MSADNRLDFEEEFSEFLINEVNETNAKRLDELGRTHSREMARIVHTPLFMQVSERYGGALFKVRRQQQKEIMAQAEKAQAISDARVANRSWLHKAAISSLRGTIERLIGVLNYLDR